MKAIIKFKGDFSGNKTAAFEIVKNPLAPGTVSADTLAVPYKKGKKNNAMKPVLTTMDGTVLKYTTADFNLDYLNAATQQKSDCIDTGNYIVRMKAKNTSRGYALDATIDVPLIVTDKPVMNNVTVAGKKSLPFTGAKQMPSLTLKYAGKVLDKNQYTTQTVIGDNYTDPGNHILILKGDGINVFGMKRISYKITGKRKLDDSKYATVTLDPASLDEKGQAPFTRGGAKPDVIVSYNGVKLKKGRDYTVSYKKNGKAGNIAALTVKGAGGYSGTVTKTFTVSQRKLSDLIVIVNDRVESDKAKDYEKTPILFFTRDTFVDQKLKKTDYTATFMEASEKIKPKAGDIISVNIMAKPGGNYTGELSASFKITNKNKDIGRAKIVIHKGKAYGYTGKEIRPDGADVVVKLGTDTVGSDKYDITYYNNVNRGSAAMVLTGKNGYDGKKIVRFRIGGSKAENKCDGLIQTIQSFKGLSKVSLP